MTVGDSPDAGEADAPIRRSFVSQRLKLGYWDWGGVDRPIMLLVHGGHDHARSWDWTARALHARWRVIAPDLRGHGDSAWSPDGAYSSPHLIGDLAALVEELGVDRVTIVAHSLGAVIALRYAALFPERVARIAAIEGIGLDPPDAGESLAQRWRGFVEDRMALRRRRPRRYATVEDALARMRAENPHLSIERARHLTVHGVTRTDDGSLRWKFDPYLRTRYPVDLGNEDQRALWRRIACPVWLVHGAQSWARHPREDGRADEFADVRITSFEGAGHWPQHDRFDAFVDELRIFLDG